MEEFCRRLKRAIEIRNIKASELSEKTGISKSNISSYISGRYKAKQDGVYILAKALDVSEAWLMGYDVPMERDDDRKVNKRYEDLSDIRMASYNGVDLKDMSDEEIEEIKQFVTFVRSKRNKDKQKKNGGQNG